MRDCVFYPIFWILTSIWAASLSARSSILNLSKFPNICSFKQHHQPCYTFSSSASSTEYSWKLHCPVAQSSLSWIWVCGSFGIQKPLESCFFPCWSGGLWNYNMMVMSAKVFWAVHCGSPRRLVLLLSLWWGGGMGKSCFWENCKAVLKFCLWEMPGLRHGINTWYQKAIWILDLLYLPK